MSPDRVARLLRAGGWAALASFGFVLALLLQPLPLDLSLRVYAVALGGIALALVLSMGSLRPLFGATAMRRPRGGTGAPARPAGLAELEHAVDFGLSSGFDLHHRLRHITPAEFRVRKVKHSVTTGAAPSFPAGVGVTCWKDDS